MKKLSLTIILLLSTFFPGSLYAGNKLPDTYAFNRGVEAYQAGDNQDALDWFNKEVKGHPDDGYAFLYISVLRYGNNEPGKAMTAINMAINCF